MAKSRITWPEWITDIPKWENVVYDLVLNGEVIYVGVSGNPRDRIKRHMYRGKEFDSVELHRFPSKKAAIQFEAERIEELKPALNKAGVTVPYAVPHT